MSKNAIFINFSGEIISTLRPFSTKCLPIDMCSKGTYCSHCIHSRYRTKNKNKDKKDRTCC